MLGGLIFFFLNYTRDVVKVGWGAWTAVVFFYCVVLLLLGYVYKSSLSSMIKVTHHQVVLDLVSIVFI